MTKRKIINDPVYDGFLSIDDDAILAVIGHPYFQRQRRIKQLGLTYLVYPGAMHTRFSHLLGALNLMGRALSTLRLKGVEITDDECLGAKLAILLHDIGHGPFSHTSERAIVDVHHEDLTLMMMERMNAEGLRLPGLPHPIDATLSTAIAIFRNTYPKHFLHQLVSSQLDMDRLDYLGRDSFFTGVSEGIVGTDRIISMLNVRGDELVVDEKGIYSVEKFIISRRLMYWQVYMHKTVIAADCLLLDILNRAREVHATPRHSALYPFMSRFYTKADFEADPTLLDHFAELDDDDVMVAVKQWQHHSDATLRTLCRNLVERRLPAIRIANEPLDDDDAYESPDLDVNAAYLFGSGELRNHAYDFADQEIKILYKDGRCLPIGEASDQLDHHFLEKQVTKYYRYGPKH